MVGFGFTREGHEDDVVPAGGFDSAREQDSFGVGIKDNLDHRLRGVGFGAGLIVGVERIQTGQVQLVIDDFVEGELECPGQQLFAQTIMAPPSGVEYGEIQQRQHGIEADPLCGPVEGTRLLLWTEAAELWSARRLDFILDCERWYRFIEGITGLPDSARQLKGFSNEQGTVD